MKKEIVFYSRPVRFAAKCDKWSQSPVEYCPVMKACQEECMPTFTQTKDSRVVVNIANTSIEQMARIRQICLNCQRSK